MLEHKCITVFCPVKVIFIYCNFIASAPTATQLSVFKGHCHVHIKQAIYRSFVLCIKHSIKRGTQVAQRPIFTLATIQRQAVGVRTHFLQAFTGKSQLNLILKQAKVSNSFKIKCRAKYSSVQETEPVTGAIHLKATQLYIKIMINLWLSSWFNIYFLFVFIFAYIIYISCIYSLSSSGFFSCSVGIAHSLLTLLWWLKHIHV